LTKVPSVNYPQVVAAFERAGWRVVRQKGSHIRVKKSSPTGTLTATIPAHKPIKRSTLAKLLKDAELDLEEFLDLLR
jgi:predicted RNA binding protein YcfA (HicA-like mRNA interferase family)